MASGKLPKLPFPKVPLRRLFKSSFFTNAAALQTYRQIFKTQQERREQERTTIKKATMFA